MANPPVRVRAGLPVSAAASEEIYRHWPGAIGPERPSPSFPLGAGRPPWVQVASEVGAVHRSRSGVVLVNGPSGDYVFCVITKNQTDTSWTPPNEGWTLIRGVSALLWNHFEPEHPWHPAPGAERLKP